MVNSSRRLVIFLFVTSYPVTSCFEIKPLSSALTSPSATQDALSYVAMGAGVGLALMATKTTFEYCTGRQFSIQRMAQGALHGLNTIIAISAAERFASLGRSGGGVRLSSGIGEISAVVRNRQNLDYGIGRFATGLAAPAYALRHQQPIIETASSSYLNLYIVTGAVSTCLAIDYIHKEHKKRRIIRAEQQAWTQHRESNEQKIGEELHKFERSVERSCLICGKSNQEIGSPNYLGIMECCYNPICKECLDKCIKANNLRHRVVDGVRRQRCQFCLSDRLIPSFEHLLKPSEDVV